MSIDAVDGAPFKHHYVDINRLKYHFVTCGSGPAVFFCHGFPDSWRVWRHQMRAVADAGYRAIAPDFRGFGETEAPEEPTSYTPIDMISDAVGILNHLNVAQAVIVGHDWGAGASWGGPVVRPDRFPAVATLSVPYSPRPPKSLPELFVDAGLPDMYMVYFNQPGRADAELNADPEGFIRRLY